MLFNSPEFLVFLVIVLLTYWGIPRRQFRLQNLLLLVASYIFYGWWDARCLVLIFLSSILDFGVSLGIAASSNPARRRLLLGTSLLFNMGTLATFKYFNFFVDSLVESLTLLGVDVTAPRLRLILPVGISFYTFQSVSYSIDVFRRQLQPARDPIAYLAFVSFFPQLVAGPIERATHLLPQFLQERRFDYPLAVDGMRQMLWGLFKKIVIADNCALYVDQIFGNYTNYSGTALLVGAVLFSLQIYGDFSGYSDIAVGCSRLFGFSLMQNFAFPYFSRDIAEFWRRWHISLSTWFRDYVYLPLGGSRCSTAQMIRNTMIVFLVSGLWHGANWTFVIWGLINAVYFLPLQLSGLNRRYVSRQPQARTLLPGLREALQITTTFLLTAIAWVFFRAESVPQALGYLQRLCSPGLPSVPLVIPTGLTVLILLFVAVEWLQRDRQHALQLDQIRLPRATRWALYYGLIVTIIAYGGDQQDFIYFQF